MCCVGANFLIQIILYLLYLVCLGTLFHFHVFLAHSEQYCVVNPNYSEGGCKLGLRVFFLVLFTLSLSHSGVILSPGA